MLLKNDKTGASIRSRTVQYAGSLATSVAHPPYGLSSHSGELFPWRQSVLRYRAILIAPSGGNGGGPTSIASARSSARFTRSERNSSDEIGSPPPQSAQAAVERAMLGEPMPGRINDRRAAAPLPRTPCRSLPWRKRRRTRQSGRHRANPVKALRGDSPALPRAADHKSRSACLRIPAGPAVASRGRSAHIVRHRRRSICPSF